MTLARGNRKVLEFLSTLDISGDPPRRAEFEGIPAALETEFGDEHALLKRATELQSELASTPDDSELLSKLTTRVVAEPRDFLLIMYTIRQIRLTNLELVRILFDPDRLNEARYYGQLCEEDDGFRAVFDRLASKSGLSRSDLGTDDLVALAIGKQAVHSYLASGEKAWTKWEARIRSDHNVAKRFAEFAVRIEGFGQLARDGAVVQTLRRSIRTANVETVKALRGKFGANRVKEMLLRSGFIDTDRPGHHNALGDLEGPSLRRVDDGPFLASEVSGESRKRFDFALFGSKGLRYLIETTYYTTSMSKVGEVVKDFTSLRNAVGSTAHLFFITDGIGWFGRTKDVEEMLMLNPSGPTSNVELPFLLNLAQFERQIPRIKLSLTAN